MTLDARRTEGHKYGTEEHKYGTEGHKFGTEGHKYGTEGHKYGTEGHSQGSPPHLLFFFDWWCSFVSQYVKNDYQNGASGLHPTRHPVYRSAIYFRVSAWRIYFKGGKAAVERDAINIGQDRQVEAEREQRHQEASERSSKRQILICLKLPPRTSYATGRPTVTYRKLPLLRKSASCSPRKMGKMAPNPRVTPRMQLRKDARPQEFLDDEDLVFLGPKCLDSQQRRIADDARDICSLRSSVDGVGLSNQRLSGSSWRLSETAIRRRLG